MSARSAEGAVRTGEELDVEKVHAWLSAQVDGLDGLPEVTQYSGGVSNWTYRLKYPRRDLVLRRPPAGTKAKGAHDMVREHDLQQALKPVYPAVPEMVALCRDPDVLGCDFYVMERLDGVILRAKVPEGLKLDPATTRRLGLGVIDKLVDLHAVDVEAAGLGWIGKGRGYPRRQIEGWSERYEKARTWNVPSFRRVRAWLAERVPDDVRTCVVHNDWRLDNVVLAPDDLTKVVGVLDWELATLGDPLMELGNVLAYWVQADDDPLRRATRRQPTHLPGMPTRREVVQHYLDRTGLRPDDFAFYEVYGLFRLAVIAQQIYYRYHHRQTRNPAFKRYWLLVGYLDWRARRVMAGHGSWAP